jgi:hypothetical protein
LLRVTSFARRRAASRSVYLGKPAATRIVLRWNPDSGRFGVDSSCITRPLVVSWDGVLVAPPSPCRAPDSTGAGVSCRTNYSSFLHAEAALTRGGPG